MTLTYNKDGKLEFELHDLLPAVKVEDKVKLIEDLSCDEAIIQHVVDQILHGWTENSYSGSTECGASANPHCALDKARREISKRSSEMAKETIEKLEKALKEKALKEKTDELQKLREEELYGNYRM